MFGAGTVGASVVANFEKRLEGMTFPGNGRPVSGSVIAASPEKLPASCVRVRHNREQRLSRCRSQPFIAAKEEELVLHHRPTAGGASLRAIARFLTEVVGRLGARVTHVVVGRAVELVRSGLGHDRNDGLPLAVLGGERVSKDVDFLHRVERRVERQIVESQRADVDAVDGVVRGTVAAALDGDVLAAAAAGRAELRASIERLRRHARGQRRERQQAPARRPAGPQSASG